MLADIAVRDPETFGRFAERAKEAREVAAAGVLIRNGSDASHGRPAFAEPPFFVQEPDT